MILFSELLKNRNFDFSQNVLLIRHKQKNISMFELIEKGYFDLYQSVQDKTSFKSCKYMIVFLGLEQTKALFYNIYEITGVRDIKEIEWPSDFFPFEIDMEKHTCYILKKIEGFEDLSERVVINWGKGTLAWAQNYSEKEIIEILPAGYLKEFSDYLDFTLSYNELRKIYDFPDANKRWIDKLSAVNGIYLILDKKKGDQYIGAAYGKDGIWGRWKIYATTGHGENKLLKSLVKNNENYLLNFQWSIMETLPSNLSKEEVLHYESKYKQKLGSRLFGLNIN